MGQIFGTHHVAQRALGGVLEPIFSPKICFFLRYTHISAVFFIERTQPNGIIMRTHPDVTLDTIGFAVGTHSAARQAVFGLLQAKVGLFGAQNQFLALKSHFSWAPSKNLGPTMMGA